MKTYILYKNRSVDSPEDIAWQFCSYSEDGKRRLIESVGYNEQMNVEDFAAYVERRNADRFFPGSRLITLSSPVSSPENSFVEDVATGLELVLFLKSYRSARTKRDHSKGRY
jgi:hypothetical protein